MLKLDRRKLTLSLLAAALIVAFAIGYCAINAKGKESDKTTDSLLAMDTYMTFTVYGDDAKAAISDAKQLIKDREARWSVTDKSSEISRLNDAGFLEVSPETADLLSLARQYSALTDGYFDPTIYPLVKAWGFTTGEYRIPEANELVKLLELVGPENIRMSGNAVSLSKGSMLDLGAVAKGYTGDLVVSAFKARGIKSAFISLGGNVQTLGRKPDGTKWNIGIQSPYGNQLLGKISVGECCVITSGAYERYFVGDDGTRYGHILSPFTGYPASNGLVSVTVVCDKGGLGDALSTALFVMGTEKAIEFWQNHEGFDVLLLSDVGVLYISEGIYASFTQSDREDVKTVCEIKRL